MQIHKWNFVSGTQTADKIQILTPEKECSAPKQRQSPLLCPALRRTKAKQRPSCYQKEGSAYPLIDSSLQENFLKLRCSIPQSDSFFKWTFFKKPWIFEKCVKKVTEWLQAAPKKKDGRTNVRRLFNGASCLTRTGDTLINSQVL